LIDVSIVEIVPSPKLSIVVATDTEHVNGIYEPMDKLSVADNAAVSYSVSVEDEIFNQADGWNVAAELVDTPYIAFSCTGVFISSRIIMDTVDTLKQYPDAIVIAHRTDEQKDGSTRFNPYAAGDWMAMSKATFMESAGFDLKIGYGGYIEFDLLCDFVLQKRPLFVLSDTVMHKYHPVPDPERYKEINAKNTLYSMSKGKPQLWWNWPNVCLQSDGRMFPLGITIQEEEIAC
jgi:hypothetical protein